MKARYTFVFVPVLGVVTWWLYPTAAKSALPVSEPAASATLQTRDAKEGTGAALGQMAASSAKIEELQTQLKLKDALIQKIMVQSAIAAQAPAEENNARIVERTAKVLDQRLFDAPQGDPESERLENALDQITAKLAMDVRTETLCAATICRLIIHGKEDASGGAATQVGNSIKGLFGATMVLSTGEGQSTMYLARNPALLDVSTDGVPTPSAGSANEAQPLAPSAALTK